jgi:hypothetical protein
MNFIVVARSNEMEAAHNDPRVIAVASGFLSFPSDGMLQLLARALYTCWDPRSANTLVAQATIPNDQRDSALRMTESAIEIANEDDPRRLRAAVLEAIAEGLVRERATDVLTEARIGPLPEPPYSDGLSTPVDVVVRGGPIEVLECKSNVFTIELRHVVQLRDVRDLAVPPATAVVSFLTLMAASLLEGHLRKFPGNGPIHGYTLEDFVMLSDAGHSPRQVA